MSIHTNKEISFEELIIEMMPFSKELVNWCKKHPEFLSGLKNIYAERFISLGAIVTSYPKEFPDEVIGVYTYDYLSNKPKFKQDFIININRANNEFVLYTRNPAGSTKCVKDIKEFFKKYGVNGNYKNSHHLSLQELPGEIKFRGEDAIRLAEKLKLLGFQKPTQEIIEKIYFQVKNIKRENRYTKKKLAKTS